MIFTIANCVSYVSQFMTLVPGDIITTGTPPGVGLGMKPPQFLKPATSSRSASTGSASSARRSSRRRHGDRTLTSSCPGLSRSDPRLADI